MKILVTGGTGFIGSHLTSALLKEGHQVRVFTRSPAGEKKARDFFGDQIEVVVGSFEDPRDLEKAVKDCEVVYHLAAIPAMRWGISWEKYEKANVSATKNLLEASAAAKIKRFIFCSSISAYGYPKVDTIDEHTPRLPADPYGKSKLEAEGLVQSSFAKASEDFAPQERGTQFWEKEHIPFTVIQPAIVYGPRDVDGVILKLCRFLKKGYPVVIGNGKNNVPLVYIDDVVDLSVLCLKKEAENKTFLQSSSKRTTLWDVVEQTAQALGVRPRKTAIPLWVALIPAIGLEASSLITKKEPLLSRPRLKTLTSDRYFKSAEAEKVFGWKAKVNFEEGIKRTVRWFEERRYL